MMPSSIIRDVTRQRLLRQLVGKIQDPDHSPEMEPHSHVSARRAVTLCKGVTARRVDGTYGLACSDDARANAASRGGIPRASLEPRLSRDARASATLHRTQEQGSPPPRVQMRARSDGRTARASTAPRAHLARGSMRGGRSVARPSDLVTVRVGSRRAHSLWLSDLLTYGEASPRRTLARPLCAAIRRPASACCATCP